MVFWGINPIRSWNHITLKCAIGVFTLLFLIGDSLMFIFTPNGCFCAYRYPTDVITLSRGTCKLKLNLKCYLYYILHFIVPSGWCGTCSMDNIYILQTEVSLKEIPNNSSLVCYFWYNFDIFRSSFCGLQGLAHYIKYSWGVLWKCDGLESG